MGRHWAYLQYVLKHKWFVFLACLQYKVSLWQAICHDWDKFLPSMWLPYARFFHESDGRPRQAMSEKGWCKSPITASAAFDRAAFQHIQRNLHHWQRWVLPTSEGNIPKKIDEKYLREMLADWVGAGRTQGGPPIWVWWEENRDKMQIHPESVMWLETQIELARVEAQTQQTLSNHRRKLWF